MRVRLYTPDAEIGTADLADGITSQMVNMAIREHRLFCTPPDPAAKAKAGSAAADTTLAAEEVMSDRGPGKKRPTA